MANRSRLHILFAEDQTEDNEIALREIRKAGIDFESRRVDTKEDFVASLASFRPDLVVSDFVMPRFDGMQALNLTIGFDPRIPFIVLTGSRNEETAVQCMKAGAWDYVIKSHINHLPYAIREALEKAKLASERQRATELFEASEERYRRLFDQAEVGLFRLGPSGGEPRDFNARLLRMLGWDREGIVDFRSEAFWPDPERREELGRRIQEEGSVENFECRLSSGDGVERTCLVSMRRDPRTGIIEGSVVDITERKKAEELSTRLNHELERRIGEKEALLRELFHRTRNNMQVIISLLGWEADRSADPAVREIVDRTNDRIMSMALVHRKLFDSKDLSRIDLNDYCRDLIAQLAGDDGLASRVRFSPAEAPLPAIIDIAVPFGLVFHELFSNAIRHAYPGGEEGEIRVALSRNAQGLVELLVADDGVGLPEDLDVCAGGGLGFQLLHGLVEGQMGGGVAIESRKGLSCRITFSISQVMDRI